MNTRLKSFLTIFILGLLFLSAIVFGSEQKFAKFDECKLANGQNLTPCHIGYRTFGKLNADRSNAILIPTWFRGTSESQSGMASENLINPDEYFVIIVDSLANSVSSSPSNNKKQLGENYPQITISDMVDSQHRLLTETLNIKSLYAIVGLSMGAMQAFEWAVRYPNFTNKIVAAIGSPRFASFDIAAWNSRNRLLHLYRECQCTEALEALNGMSMTVLVPTKLEEDIPREKILETIVTRSKSMSLSNLSTWDHQRQTEAMLSHNIARDFDNNMELAVKHIKAKFLIIIGADDRVVTPEPALNFAKLANAELLVLDKDCGHGDPWCAPNEFANAVKKFISLPK